MIPFINLQKQQGLIKESLDKRMQAVLAHGQYIMGPEVKELESLLAEYTGTKHCITVGNGTDALLIALLALGIKAGDEVITSPFTFIATAEMIAFIGAKPVFVDIDPDTYNMDVKLLRQAITGKTKAIMPVSLYGQCADMDEISAIASEFALPVIEDAAQSFGATYKGQKSCNLSTVACTSFFPSKPLGCYGDGGACFTNDDKLATLMGQIRLHGQDRRYNHSVLGMNGRMDTLQAAVLLAKMEIFPREVALRAKIGATYTDSLKEIVKTPHVHSYNMSVYAQYTVEVDSRDAVQKALKLKGVPTMVHYPIPLHLQPVFAYLNLTVGSFPVAEAVSKRVMSLPMDPWMEEHVQETITKELILAVK